MTRNSRFEKDANFVRASQARLIAVVMRLANCMSYNEDMKSSTRSGREARRRLVDWVDRGGPRRYHQGLSFQRKQ